MMRLVGLLRCICEAILSQSGTSRLVIQVFRRLPRSVGQERQHKVAFPSLVTSTTTCGGCTVVSNAERYSTESPEFISESALQSSKFAKTIMKILLFVNKKV